MSTRYFQSSVTGRPLVVNTPAGERSFNFEPIEPMGGSWLGVLAVDDDSAASILANCEGAWEIMAEKYDALKKKRAGVATAKGFAPSRTPQLPPQPLVASADPAERRSDSPSNSDILAQVSKPVASVSLLTTDKKPPAEPLLDIGLPRRRKAA